MKASVGVNKVHELYGDQVNFIFIYLREAHPKDGWAIPGWSVCHDAKTIEERMKTALECKKVAKFQFPIAVDDMKDTTAVAYAAWPERLYVVDTAGKIVYAGDQGPWGFFPAKGYKTYGSDNPRQVPPMVKNELSLEGFLEKYLSVEVEAELETMPAE